MTPIPTGPAMADTLGTGATWWDPLWRVRVALTPLEQALLRTWPVRRLGFVAFAGASAVASAQSGTRLEHSLGVLALTAHHAPHDLAARAAALLHDVGHLPFSHTLEGLGGLAHHVLGRARIADLDGLLRTHGTGAAEVVAVLDGTRPSVLTPPAGVLKLDHLDGVVRSATSHGRTRRPAPDVLARVVLHGAGVSTDAEQAQELAEMVADEARLHTAPLNVVADAVLRELVGRLVGAGDVDLATLATWTDDEVWAALLQCPATAADTRAFRLDPTQWEPTDAEEPGLTVVRRLYLSLPLVDGRASPLPHPAFAGLPASPVTFRVRRRPAAFASVPDDVTG